MPLGIDEIEELIDAAVAAEAWFIRQEMLDPKSLDSYADSIHDKLRIALEHIQKVDSEQISRAHQAVGHQFPLFT